MNGRIVFFSYDIFVPNSGSGKAMLEISENLQNYDVIQTNLTSVLESLHLNSNDIIVTQQWATREAKKYVSQYNCKMIIYIHGPGQYEKFFERGEFSRLKQNLLCLWAVSEKEKNLIMSYDPEVIVLVVPPLSKIHQGDPIRNNSSFITLICSEEYRVNKGFEIISQIANLKKEWLFLVVGDWNNTSNWPVNVFHKSAQPDLNNIFSYTKILLCPSEYESYGKTAIEGELYGLPVIATRIPTYSKNLLSAQYVERRDNVEEWISKIENILFSSINGNEIRQKALSVHKIKLDERDRIVRESFLH